MKRFYFVLVLTVLIVNQVICQSALQQIKKNIKSYLFTTLHDFNSYDPVEYSDLQQVYSQLENDVDYEKYSSSITNLITERNNIAYNINLYKNARIINLEKNKKEHQQKLEKAQKDWQTSIDSLSKSIKLNEIMFETKQLNEIELQLPKDYIALKEYENKYTQNIILVKEDSMQLIHIKENFKSITIGYHICHKFRAKNSLGAMVLTVQCFLINNSYQVIQEVEN